MYNFNQHLLENEKIIREFKPVSSKFSKSIKGELMLLGIFIAFMVFLFFMAIYNIGRISMNDTKFWVLIAGIVILIMIVIYSMFNRLKFGSKFLEDYFYCLTDKRIMYYNKKKKNLYIGYLEKLTEMEVRLRKENYGDIILFTPFEETKDSINTFKQFIKKLRVTNKNDVEYISMICIENPHVIVNAIIKIQKEKYNKEGKITFEQLIS